MTCYKICIFYIVRRAHGRRAEAQVAFCNAEGFLRVILKISLGIFIRVVVDYLDSTVVCAHCSVGTESPELTRNSIVIFCLNRLYRSKAQMCDVVIYADCKSVFRLIRVKIFKHRRNIGRSCVF